MLAPGRTTGAGAPAALLDRDGTIVVDHGYLGDPDRVDLLPGAASAVGDLRRRGWVVVVVTNQSGIGRGLIGHDEVEAIHRRLDAVLATADPDARIDGYHYCPHAPDALGRPTCPCRKPRPGLFLRAARIHQLDLARSIAIGDAERDVAAARAAGCMSAVRVGTDGVPSLAAAVASLGRTDFGCCGR